MAKPQIKKRFSFFSSTQKSPPLSPQNLYNNTSSYFLSQEIRDDNNPTTDDIRISIENLEKLVLAADEYRDYVNKLSKISKNFSKCLKDYSNCKGIDKSYVQCIQFTSQFYEHHAEIQAKLNKALQKEFETLQKFWDRYSKKVEKDEKAHNDYVGDLDKQIKKISKDHEKKSKKENKYALESHDKYIASLTSIGSDIARARTEYAEEVMKREKHTHSVISQVVCRFIEGQFASFNDSLKKCGPSITKVKEWASFAGQDTCIPSQLNLDSFLEMQTMTESDISNDELVSSEKQPRKSPNKISQSIASISELQKAVMNNKLQETEPLTEECEKIEENLSPQIPITLISEKPSDDHDFSISVETTTTTVVTNVSKNTKNRSTIPSVPPIITATTVINPPISSTNVPNSKEKPSSTKNKPLTPNLLSSLSIGIHDGDNPFFRDDGGKKITEMTDLMEDKETKQIKTIMMIDNQGSSIHNDEKESSTKLEENNIVSLTPPPIYDRSRDITKNDRWSSKKDQLKNEDEINSFPVKNTFRLSFIENNPENGVNNNDESHDIDDKRIVNEKEIRPTSSLSSFETERLVNSFPIDLPIRPIPQNCQLKSNCGHDQTTNNNKETILHRHSDSLRNDVEKHVAVCREPENKGMRDESYVTYPPTHSTKQQRQYNINPRRAYTEYPLPNRLSVADIRDRLLSSLNANERISSTRSTHDLPKPKQGYVNEVKSKFGGINNSRNNDNITVIPRSTSFKDDMYLDQIECSKEINSESSSQSIVNEQCNCHNCQEIRRVMNMNDARNRNHHLKDSFLPDDDLTTFGRNNY
ncbi:hypothetical protein RhiirA5_399275 [Rhizophagus irregularis]|uniref:Uncharacterized protein n=1 Tax=Rhizophagus irregularis TaxID=588596 RepID=A0A2I1E716_9GLOM|nr:hypothetical protein RhiirA5_399275 [Rhizophagus irregularis]PKC68990.1 hypothetical protein RhiirA1_440279 [Rhizophagus irregularis]PKY17925.1 hypothetical protein RhiirB3_489507 [Rhizophagus irregularis]CAB4493353.1 unnamed protein product [Rhizophagus irregularis]CAB5202359.1 unnamed protein product [Rhizophagus irregularis]